MGSGDDMVRSCWSVGEEGEGEVELPGTVESAGKEGGLMTARSQ